MVAVTGTVAPLAIDRVPDGLKLQVAPDSADASQVALTCPLYANRELRERLAIAWPGDEERVAGPVIEKSPTLKGTLNEFVIAPDVPCTTSWYVPARETRPLTRESLVAGNVLTDVGLMLQLLAPNVVGQLKLTVPVNPSSRGDRNRARRACRPHRHFGERGLFTE